jgi:AcrR family transcriptional regulator
MARRNDHEPEALRQMFLAEGHRHLAEVGFARFSAREVARRVGYSVGTLYNVFGTLDRLLFEINTMTFRRWADLLERRLARAGDRRLDALVEGYFEFAFGHRSLWEAIWAHQMPAEMPLPEAASADRSRLTGIVIAEVAAALPEHRRDAADSLARSLIATVHGHCDYALSGTFAMMGEADPLALAKSRVWDAVEQWRARGP